MFNDLFDFSANSFEIAIYVILTFAPMIILSLVFRRVKDKFFELNGLQFCLSQEKVMFEIKNPKEIYKTPEAMENVMKSFYNASKEGSWVDRVWKNQKRPVYSLEIVSINGTVRFYIWARKALKELIEASFYSQYPEVELTVVDDYAKYFSLDKYNDGKDLFGVEYNLTKPDPLPIKTYKYWTKDWTKAEAVIDPISLFIEVLGNVGQGENFWLQFVIRAQKKDFDVDQTWWQKLLNITPDKKDWSDMVSEEIKKLKKKVQEVDNEDEDVKLQPVISDAEKEILNATIENTAKPTYWTGIRALYFAEPGRFNSGQITPILSLFNHFKSDKFNTFGISFYTGFDYAWQDPSRKRTLELKKGIFNDYRRRKFFGDVEEIWPNKKKYQTSIFSVEELATLFHPPTSTTAAPSFERIESKKADPPANLPI